MTDTRPTADQSLHELAGVLSAVTLSPNARLKAVADARSVLRQYHELGITPNAETVLALLLGASLQARATAAAGLQMMLDQARALGLPDPGQVIDPTAAKVEAPLSYAMAIVARDITEGRLTADPDPVDEQLAKALATLLGAVDRYDGDLGPITGDAHLTELLEPIIAAAGPWLARLEMDDGYELPTFAQVTTELDLVARIRQVLDRHPTDDCCTALRLDVRSALVATDTACTRCAGTGAIYVAGERRPCPGDDRYADSPGPGPHHGEEG